MKINNICCIGAGYVGGPTMAVIALKCPEINVTVVDKNEDKIKAWNSNDYNEIPVFEPGLKEIIQEVRDRNLFFSTDIKLAVEESEMIFLAVNTPTKTKGEGAGMAADLTNVENSAREIAKFANSNKIIVEKSTLPVRTAEKLKEILELSSNNYNFQVLSNPEFLAEGTAIKDLFNSDRVLIGGEDTPEGEKAVNALVSIYKKWIPEQKILKSNVWSAELSKLASNAMLAQRISSINSLSAVCAKTGANILEVSKAVGADSRIGNKFLQPSIGFGGSCFQKDILNLVYLSIINGLPEVAEYWHQVVKINNYQRKRFANLILEKFEGNLSNTTISLLGWSYKKNTNDSRESASIYVSEMLLDKGANLNVYDPKVPAEKIKLDIENRLILQDLNKKDRGQILSRVKIFNDIYECCSNVSTIAILTEWIEFQNLNWQLIENNMNAPYLVVDGRFIISEDKLSSKLNLISI
jgi:UDPglucose 6-dehydrogenase